MLPCHGREREFDPRQSRQILAVIAQLVERSLGKTEVGGSIPPVGTMNYLGVAQSGQSP